MDQVTEMYGTNVFNEQTMRERLPKETFRELEKTIQDGKPLNIKIANAVAHAMKVWAIEKGATHFTHWFQPMTGVTTKGEERAAQGPKFTPQNHYGAQHRGHMEHNVELEAFGSSEVKTENLTEYFEMSR